MNAVILDHYKLAFHKNYIQLELFHGAHFNIDDFQFCFDLKLEIYGTTKIGVLVRRQNFYDTYSFDPMLLLAENGLIEKHARWIAVVSDKKTDRENLEFIKYMTTIPCHFFSDSQKAEAFLFRNSYSR